MYNLYGSFSQNKTSFGYYYFNKKFKEYDINAIYQPFYINNLKIAIESVKELNILGVGISKPFKIEIMNFLDEIDNDALAIGACNTILNNGKLIGYNTDWKALYFYINNFNLPTVILGNGGYAKSAFYACKKLNREYINITRKNWNYINNIYNSLIINCTPVFDIKKNNNIVFHANIETQTGKDLALKQAKEQFKLYTGIDDVSIY